MIQTDEAIIDSNGIIPDEEPATAIPETALLAEPALADDWDRFEEDEAWQHLQPTQ
ncbi:MAG: hypothetical protein SF339_04965 [Blastocatellia bacterium]|nr:hypothetical protein [Blastocatellia bacterium]